ncbi:universal stress protein [Candidatus Bathyarchaeota archaeon ex4484_231]|nr:MAG: universal stress protein [Candidatus Bathyarchaeota archaeon ex4484_231]RJS74651.1 MAG: universal stress protein [Candidatus Bathyarchaeota archaeon]
MSEDKFLKRILIPTDGSDPSMRAAEFAIKIAKHFNSEIVAIYVIDRVILEEVSKVHERHGLEEEIRKNAERCLNYIVKLAERKGLKARSIVVEGQPHDQIVRYAESLKANMIIIGSKGRRGMNRILIGSVAERVIEYAPCPVLVIK